MRTRIESRHSARALTRAASAPFLLVAALACSAWACQKTATPSAETESAGLGVATASAQELRKPAIEPPKAAEPPKLAEAPKAAEAPAPKGGDTKLTQGAVASDEAFSTWLQAESPAKAGGPVIVEAVLTAKPPYHCNAEYPHKFKLNAAPAGLSYPEETVRGMKVTPERSVLAIPVKAEAAGKPTISGTLSFSVCTAERCMVEKRDLTLALDVK